jgi:formate dehydrogenase maturation protein FdhE
MKDDKKLERMHEAYKNGYIQSCPKCGSFKVTSYIDEDYFSNPLRYGCAECKHQWAG